MFYVDNTKKHGKIVSLDCSPSLIPWMNFPSYTSCNNMDDGSQNTLPVGPLKSWIQGKGTGWYCPAKQELHRICSSIVIINNKLASLGCKRIGNFYWSSTQYSVKYYDLAYIVCVAESNYMGYQPGWSGWTSKTSSYGALAVKKF